MHDSDDELMMNGLHRGRGHGMGMDDDQLYVSQIQLNIAPKYNVVKNSVLIQQVSIVYTYCTCAFNVV